MADRRGLSRALVTPEGVDLRLMLASVGERASAFLLDLIVIVLTLVGLTIAVLLLFGGTSSAGRQALAVIWLLGFFVLRNGYFIAFELGPRAATPGKRAMKLRVVARDGGRLSGPAVIARNTMRELELFLPLGFLAYQSSQGLVDVATGAFGLLWTGIFAIFPLVNRDRLRVGDLIAGTWVVRVPRRRLNRSVAAAEPEAVQARYTFTDAELGAYGEFELQKLEEVLRREDELSMIVVARTIRARLGWPPAEGEEHAFLEAYYTALSQRLERNMLFGRRKRDKHQR